MYNMPEEKICRKQLQDTDRFYKLIIQKMREELSETEHTAVLKLRNIFKTIRKIRS